MHEFFPCLMKVFESTIDEAGFPAIQELLKTGDLGFGASVGRFERQFAPFSQKNNNISTNSASAAAFLIFSLLKERYGVCDVYTPSLGFASPSWAAKHLGHNLIWVDVDSNLLFDCEDYRKKRKLNSDNKPVLMPILYGGVSTIPYFSELKNDNHDEVIVVDSAHCVTPSIDSDFTFFSFHPYKPICSSDGGMIATDDNKAAEYFKCYRNFGRENVQNTYGIVQDGFKFYMNNLNATLALISLGSYSAKREERLLNFNHLNNIRGKNLLPHDCDSSYYFATEINGCADQLNAKYNLARHYPLLHKTKYFGDGSILANSEFVHDKIVNWPLYITLI